MPLRPPCASIVTIPDRNVRAIRGYLPFRKRAVLAVPRYFSAESARRAARIITISECADGYVITHRTNPATAGDATETFVMIADDWDQAVGDATGKDYEPYSDFDESEAPFAREVTSGEYAEPTDFEMRDYVSKDKVIRRTAGAAREEAEMVLQEFFEQNPPVA